MVDLTRPADSWLPGQVPAQEAKWAAVGNTVMSAPVSATITSAVRTPIGQIRLTRPLTRPESRTLSGRPLRGMDGNVLAREEGTRVCLELHGFVCMDKVTCIDGDEMAI